MTADPARSAATWWGPVWFLAWAILLLRAIAPAHAFEQGAVATIVAARGDAQVLRAGQAEWIAARTSMALFPGDTVRTGSLGQVALVFADESVVKVHRMSQLTLRAVAQQAGWIALPTSASGVAKAIKSIYELGKGRLWLRNKNRDVDIEIHAPNVTTSIRGTELDLAIDDAQTTTVSVIEGAVEASNAGASLRGSSGEAIVATADGRLTKRVLVNPRNAVQWTVELPEFFHYSDVPLAGGDSAALAAELAALDASSQPSAAATLRAARIEHDLGRPADCLRRLASRAMSDDAGDTTAGWCALEVGDLDTADARFERSEASEAVLGRVAVLVARFRLDDAVAAIEGALRRDPQDLAFGTQRAVLDILAGRHDEAEARLAAIVAAHPDAAVAWRHRALVAVIRDDLALAREASARALALAPRSPLGHLVAAYVAQAMFDLPAAERANHAALALDPANVTARLNLARLAFGDDRDDEALDHLATAATLAPEDAERHALLGFVLLARHRGERAASEFERALSHRPAHADAWLGRALIAMRRGDTAGALEAITTAIAIEPQRSLYLSYWAKMLYQVRRFEKALDVLEHAHRLDPRDPTPLFYRAMILRDLNRPGLAVRSLQQAVALNDHRGVYRSRFLLDRDLAVRNVDLSTLFDDLGLERWARTRAAAAVQEDFRNYSAHLALAGALAQRPERAFAFANEQLLARLLQPANVNAFNTFNDYTALFEQQRANADLRVAAGSFGRLDGDVIAFGNLPAHHVAWQAGAFHEGNAGWRAHQGSDFTSGAGVLKWEPSARDGVLVSFDVLESRQRGEPFRRDEIAAPGDRLEHQDVDQARFEIGYHRRASRDTDWLAYFTYMDQAISWRDHGSLTFQPSTGSTADIDFAQRGTVHQPLYEGQLQAMHAWRDHHLVAGVLALGRPLHLVTGDLLSVTLRVPAFNFVTTARQFSRFDGAGQMDFHTFYVRDVWSPFAWLSVDGALYGDHLAQRDPATGLADDQAVLDPRFGVVFRLSPADTVRVAAFRYLLPFTPARIDPGDVAGIPIARTVTEGSRVFEYAGRYEHEWTRGLVALEAFRNTRVATAPRADTRTHFVEQDGSESGIEIEFDQLLTDALAFTARYAYGVLRDDDYPPAQVFLDEPLLENDRTEQSIAVGLRLRLPRGFGARVDYVHRHLDLRAGRRDQAINALDLRLGQELPGNRGRLELRVDNLFDSGFNWLTDRYTVVGRAPAREIVGSVILSF